MVAINNAVVMLSPPTMSIWGLKAQLAISEAEAKIVASKTEGGQDVESLIGNALKSGGKVGSQTGEAPADANNGTQAEMSNQEREKLLVLGNARERIFVVHDSSTPSPADVR